MQLKKLNLLWKIIATLIEVFDVRSNQIDFFMDMNKPYIIGSDAYDLIDKYKKPEEIKEPKPKAVPKPKPVSDAIKESRSEPVAEKVEKQAVTKTTENIVPTPDNTSTETKKLSETETVKQTENDDTVKEDVPEIKKIEPIKEQILEDESTRKNSRNRICQ